MNNRKHSCKKTTKKQPIICTLALLHNKCNEKYLLATNLLVSELSENICNIDYTIYRMHCRKENHGASSVQMK